MAIDLHSNPLPAIAATPIADNFPVRVIEGATQRCVGPLASTNQEPFGITDAGATSLAPVTVHGENSYTQAIAAASLGAGAAVGIASTGGRLGPVVGASGSIVYRVGIAAEPAAAGEYFAVYVNPRQLSGLA